MILGSNNGNTTITGINFERKVSLLTSFTLLPNYTIQTPVNRIGNEILHNNVLVARNFKKHQFYSFLDEQNINWKNVLSKKLLPDDVLLINNTLSIFEVKFQQTSGSTDEKLQTCDFKYKQYKKLLNNNFELKYIYILNDWFKKIEYKDVLQYITDNNCNYYFNTISLSNLKIPD